MKICRGPECGRPALGGKGLCPTHYAQNRRGKELKPIRGHSRQISDEEHLRAYQERVDAWNNRGSELEGKFCIGPKCDRPAEVLSPDTLCRAHYMQLYYGKELTPLRHSSKQQPVDAPERVCTVCYQKKSRDEFYTRATGNPQSECKFCAGKRSRITRLFREGRDDEAQALIRDWEAVVGLNRNGWVYVPTNN